MSQQEAIIQKDIHGRIRAMTWQVGQRTLLAGMTGLATSLTFSKAFADGIPAKPESGGIKMGLEPWLGYGQWHVAAKKGFFKANRPDDVELVNFTQDPDLNGSLATGKLDTATVPSHTAMARPGAGFRTQN